MEIIGLIRENLGIIFFLLCVCCGVSIYADNRGNIKNTIDINIEGYREKHKKPIRRK